MAKSQSTTSSKTKSTKAKASPKKTATESKAASAKRSTTQAKRTATAKKTTKSTKKTAENRMYYVDQSLLKAPRLVFGLYLSVAMGAIGYVKYYLQTTLPNEIFTQATSDLYIYWIGLLEMLVLAGIVALVALPAYGYYRRFGLRTLGVAFVTAFLILSVALAGLGFYVDAQPEPETPNIQQQLQQAQ